MSVCMCLHFFPTWFLLHISVSFSSYFNNLFYFISFLLLLTFGTFQVLLGEVNTGLNTTQVVVKELKSSASVQDQMHFLEEVQPYRYTFPSVTSGRDPITASQIENKHGVISDPERVDQNHVFVTGKFSLILKNKQ